MIHYINFNELQQVTWLWMAPCEGYSSGQY